MDDATYTCTVYFDDYDELVDPQESAKTPLLLYFTFKHLRQLELTTATPTPIPLLSAEARWEISSDDFSAEGVRQAIAPLRLPQHVADDLAVGLHAHALAMVRDPRIAATPMLAFWAIVTATVSYDESSEIDGASSEAEAGSFRAAPRPASGVAIAALKEARFESDANSTCVICLEELGQRAAARLPCSHAYHKDCIVQWLEISHLCPLCCYAMPT